MTRLPQLPRKVWTGLALFYLAGLGWLACIVLPFTHVPHKVGLALLALCVAEASFLVGAGLIGKVYYRRLKQRLMDALTKKP